MTRIIKSRRLVPAADRPRPLYARVLGLQYINPGGLLCFIFFEGMIALAVLLTLAEQVDLWAVAVLPATVAAAVKINDVVAGALLHGSARASRVVGRAGVPVAPDESPTAPLVKPPAWVDETTMGIPRLRPARQPNARTYD